MSAGKIALLAVFAGVLGLGSAVLTRHLLDARQVAMPPPQPIEDGDLLDRLPEFSLPDPAGGEVASSRWTGKVLVLNFWATWCPPCLREMPLFDELHREHSRDGLQIVGIAIDDAVSVEQFLFEHPVDFQILLGDDESIEMARRLGNRMQGLPFTVIFDRQGNRVYARTGEVTRASLSEQLDPLLSQSPESRTPGNQQASNR